MSQQGARSCWLRHGARLPFGILKEGRTDVSNKHHNDKISVARQRFVRLGSLTILAAALAGCAITPQPLAEEEQFVLALADREAMYAQQEPVTQAITLEEAIARAVKYNLQHRLMLMERALEDNLADVQGLDMLPKLTARAGFKTRDNTYASSSYSVESGRESLEPSTSQERNIRNADLQLSWNVLDFGLSYFGAKAQANKILASEERRRRVVADIIREVRTAYWNAVTAERLKNEVSSILGEARTALSQARETERQRLLAPINALKYQRDLLGMVRQVEALESDLALAKSRLASLMNLPPASQYDLVVPAAASLEVPRLAYGLEDLETLSMVRRPEIREEAYLARNAVLETRMSLLRLLPGVSLFGGLNYDSNKYLVNNNWADAGMQVSWNLFNVLSWPAISKAGDTREAVAQLRRQALRMAVLTQVNVSYLEFQRAASVFERSKELDRIQRAILQQTEGALRSDAQTVLETIRTRVETVLATRARDLSYADLQNAMSAIHQAAGIDPLPQTVADDSVAGLAAAVADSSRVIDMGGLQVPRLMAESSLIQQAVPVEAATPVAQTAQAVAAAPVAQQPALRPVAVSMWSSTGSLVSGQAALDQAERQRQAALAAEAEARQERMRRDIYAR